MPPSGDVVNDAAIPFLLPSRLSGRSISLSRNAAGARAAGRNLFGNDSMFKLPSTFSS